MQTETFLLFISIFRALSRVFWDYGFLRVRKCQVFWILPTRLKKLRIQILYIITINYTVTELISFTKNLHTLNEPKLAKWQQIYSWKVSCPHNGNHKIIANKYLYVCIKLCFIVNFVILQIVSGLFKETDDETWGFCYEKKHEWLRQQNLVIKLNG